MLFFLRVQGITLYLVFSAEAYVYSRSAAFLSNQLNFMKADLAAVDRRATPWVSRSVLHALRWLGLVLLCFFFAIHSTSAYMQAHLVTLVVQVNFT